jgi:sialidase-1
LIDRYTTSILNIFLKLLELLPREFKNTKLNYEVVYLEHWNQKDSYITGGYIMFFDKSNLEEFGIGGYMMYRIPGIVVTNHGTVLAYYEARMGKGDWTKQDIYLRRSQDNGDTWEERILLVKGAEEETLHNAVMITENSGNTIHFLWGQNYNRYFYQKSSDEGLNWSDPAEITYVFEQFRLEYDWNVIAVGPGHGIQLKNGKLFAPVWLSTGGKSHRPSVVSSIYSDDCGATWHRGEIVWASKEFINPNETSAVQLSNGYVLMNMRHESKTHFRAVTISKNGANDWSTPVYDTELPDPICCGSILRLADDTGFGSGKIIFSNCACQGLQGGNVRTNLSIKMSLDLCRSWKYNKLLEQHGGYSDLAASTDGRTMFCFYERDWVDGSCFNIKYLTVARFNTEWITRS